MQTNSNTTSTVMHSIPDMTETPLRELVLRISATHFGDVDSAEILLASISKKNNEAVIPILRSLLEAPKESDEYVQGLQILGAAFTQARGLDTEPPEDLNQSQWNRALRDQGERLRAASLTLGRGRASIAALQLEPLSDFFTKHFKHLPA